MGQTGVDRSVVVLRVTSVVWVESVVGEEVSVPGQSNVTLALSAERCRCSYSSGQTKPK